jgi:cytochrome b pre-mRNA-processing protein 3
MIVAQARKPAFYQSYGVPDTVEGRLDMIVLHLLFDHFCRDIDGNLREMGIGDLAVPKHMQRVAGTFYGRAEVYGAALDLGDDAALEAAVARNVFGTAEPSLGARRLATYMREASRRIGGKSLGTLASAELDFPDPTTITQP